MAGTPEDAKSESDAEEQEKLDFDDETLKAIAEVYKDEGNNEYKKKEFKSAVDFYTDGLKVNCKDDELNAKLYSNRATANFHLGNYHDTLADATAAVKLQPTYIKAIERGASACVKLGLHEEAITWCDKGLAMHSTNKVLLDLRRKCIVKVNKLDRDEQERNNDGKPQDGKGQSQVVTMGGKGKETQKDNNASRSLKDAKICLEGASEIFSSEGAQVILLPVLAANNSGGLGDRKQAVDYYELLLKIAKRKGDRRGESGAYCNLGNAYFRLGNFTEAFRNHELYLKRAKEVGDRVGEGDAYCCLGNGYLSIGDSKKAIEYYELSLEIFKEVGSRQKEGSAYCGLGIGHLQLGYPNKAFQCHEMHLEISKEVGSRLEEGVACANLGIYYHSVGDFKTAIHYHEQLLEIAKEVSNRAQEGVAYGLLGNEYQKLGSFKRAIHYHELHLKIAKELGKKDGEGFAYGNLACGHASLGDFKKAIQYLELCLKLAKECGNRAREGMAYGNLGSTHVKLGDFQKAIYYNELYLTISKELGNKADQGRAYRNLGIDYQSIGDFKKAIQYHEKHLEIAKLLGNKNEEGDAYGNLGNCYSFMENLKKAIRYHDSQLRIAKNVGNRTMEGEAYGNLGEDYYTLMDTNKAIQYHELHLEISKELGNKSQEGDAYGGLGNAYASIRDFEKSQHYHELQLKFAKEVGDRVEEAVAYNNLGCSFESQGSLIKAGTCFRSSVGVLNDVRAGLHLEDERKINLRHLYQTAYTRLWIVELKQGNLLAGLLAAEQGRTQALKDLMTYSYGLAAHEDDSGIPDEAIVDTISQLKPSTIFLALTRKEVVSWFFQKGNVVLRTQPTNDNRLDDTKMYIDSLVKSVLAEIGVAGIRCEDRSLGEDKDENRAKGSLDQTHSHPEQIQSGALRTLYDMICGVIADSVGGDELVIVPEGPLWLAPYAALTDANSKFLSESFRIRVIPSFTTLKLIADCPRDYHHKRGALLVGDPWVQEVILRNGRKLKQLPCAREEVQMIGKILNIKPLTGTEATKDEVLKRLSSVALVHIAAHGRMETGEIALSPDPSRESQVPEEADYLLTITDVLRVKLRARLVVLSCCHSGRGDIKAEGVVGIARAFLGAGARSVLVSLWAIDDEATLEVMEIFYKHLAEGRCASEALRQAMKSMRESDMFSEVKYWAPFVLIGDDVTMEFGAGGQ